MRYSLPLTAAFVAAVLASAAALSAQGAVAPAVTTVVNPHPALSAPAVPGSTIQQVHMISLPGDPPGTYLTACTATVLPTANGGVGGSDFVTGRYNALTDTFTADLDAAALNAAGTDFGLMLHHTGLFAVYDRLPGPPQMAIRPNLTSPWLNAGSVVGLPGQSYYDPSVANVGGQMHLVFVYGQTIAMAPLDFLTGQVGTITTLVLSGRSGTPNSPTPIVDSNGELIAISHHDVIGSDNDHFMSFDLDPNTPALMMYDSGTTWINNGGFAAGRFFDADSAGGYHVFSMDTHWFSGGRAKIGGNMEITANIPPTTSTDVHVANLMVSVKFLPVPMAIPGIGGEFGLDPAVLIGVPMGLYTAATGKAVLTFPVPNNPALSGHAIPAQSFSINLTKGTGTFGNTAALTIL